MEKTIIGGAITLVSSVVTITKMTENMNLTKQNDKQEKVIKALSVKAQKLEEENIALQKQYKNEAYEQAKNQNIDFYDFIIDTTTIRELPKVPNEAKVLDLNNENDALNEVIHQENKELRKGGWDIIKKPNYENLVSVKGKVVSVVGNYNKGKTFLLTLLSHEPAPHGFHISTKGISVKYVSKNKEAAPIITLDTAGSSLPIFRSERKLKRPDDRKAGEDSDYEIDNDEDMRNFQDRQFTEDLQQNFLLNHADVIILVVSDLTFEDQKLIEGIKKKYTKKKKIIVVHNLYHCTEIFDVSTKIQERIKKAFYLKENKFGEYIVNEKDNFAYQNRVYYSETFEDNVVNHLVIAKHNSKAGDYFNHSALSHIETIIQGTEPRRFEVLHLYKEYLIDNLGNYISNEVSREKISDNDGTSLTLELNRDEQIKFKPLSSDELGMIRTHSNKFKPRYQLYREEESLCLRYFIPGDVVAMQTPILNVDPSGWYTITVQGKYSMPKIGDELIISTHKEGDFEIMTPRKDKMDAQFDLNPEVEEDNGCYIVRFKIKKALPNVFDMNNIIKKKKV